MVRKYKCPKCGGKRFSTTAHVCQDWMVDEDAEFIETISECIQVTHRPDEDNLWSCLECDYEAAGSAFKGSIPVMNEKREQCVMTTMLEFIYETGDSSKGCQYWQCYIIVKSDEPIDNYAIEKHIEDYMRTEEALEKDYDEKTEAIMNLSGYEWFFLDNRAVSINNIHTFWV